MTLNTTGPISLGGPIAGQSVNLELGNAANATIAMGSAAYRNLVGAPASGPVTAGAAYGKGSTLPPGVFLAPLISNGLGGYPLWGGPTATFLPNGGLPNTAWYLINQAGFEEASPAYSPTTLSIIDGTGADLTINNNVMQSLIKIEVIGTDGSVLGSYSRAQLVQYASQSLGVGLELYLPIDSLNLFQQYYGYEVQLNTTSGLINDEMVNISTGGVARYTLSADPYGIVYSLSSTNYTAGQTITGQTSGVTRTIISSTLYTTVSNPNQPFWGSGRNDYALIVGVGPLPVTNSNLNTFPGTGLLHTKWYFTV